MISYEFCVGAPTWPGCAELIADHEAEQAAQNANGNGRQDGDMDDDKHGADPMMGQIVYTATAVGMSANALLKMTRYEDQYDWSTADSVYDNTNWIEMYHMVADYSGAAFWTVAAITQLATVFGALANYNLMVWAYGGMIYSLAGLAVEIMMWVARDQANESDDANAGGAYIQVESDWTSFMAEHAAVALELYWEMENWGAAQWELLSDEEKEMWEESDMFSLTF